MRLSTINLQKRLSTHLNQLPLWFTLVAAWLAGAIFICASASWVLAASNSVTSDFICAVGTKYEWSSRFYYR